MASGRGPHAEKITVYLSEEEYIALEEFKLNLRRQGIKKDRSEIVRDALSHALNTHKDISRHLSEEM